MNKQATSRQGNQKRKINKLINRCTYQNKNIKLNLIENETNEYFTAVQMEMLCSLQNVTGILKYQQSHTKIGMNNRTEELNQRITNASIPKYVTN